MAKRKLSKKLTRQFAEHYAQNNTWETPEELLFDLVENGLTDPERVRNYLIIADYPEYLAHNEGHCMDTAYQLSDKYNLSARQVQNIVYRWRKRY